MKQPRNLLELIELVKPTAAFFTTYTFDVKYFDVVVLPALREVGCEVISVLVDADKAAKCARDFTSRAAGRKYRVATVIAPGGGVFHPKLAYLVGKSDHVLSVGSGNLTAAGLAIQLESLDAVSALQAPSVFVDLRGWMLTLAEQIALNSAQASDELRRFAVHAAAATQLNQVEQPATEAQQVAIKEWQPAVLVHTLNAPAREILQSIFLARADSAKSVTVLTPFHAPDGRPVLSLAKAVKANALHVGLDGRASLLTAPFQQSKFKRPRRCKFVVARLGYDGSDKVETGEDAENEGSGEYEEQNDGTARVRGRLHAKVFVLQAEDGALVMTGSINATAQSFEGTKNVEVSLARWLPKSPFKWRQVEPEVYAVTQAPSDFEPQCPFYVEASLDGTALQGVLSPPGKVLGAVHLEVTNGVKLVYGIEVQLTEVGKFSFGLTAEFDKKAGLQLTATHGAAAATCFVSILEELDALPTVPGSWDPRDRDALGRLRGGHCSIDDLTRLLERFIPVRTGGGRGQGPANATRPGPGTNNEGAAPPSRALSELARAARLAAEALQAPTVINAGTESEPSGQNAGSFPPRTSRGGKPKQSTPGKSKRGNESGEKAFYRNKIFWNIQQLHEKHPRHKDSVAIAAFAAHWALDMGHLQKDGPELCSVWLERFSWQEYPEGGQQALSPLAAAMACVAALRLEQRNKLPPLSQLRESVELFAEENLSEQRLLALCEEGLQLDTFAAVARLDRLAARGFVGRLATAPPLDDKVLALLRKARTEARRNLTREPEAQGFESIARELQHRPRHKPELLRGLVARNAAGCPFCFKSLEDDHRTALRKYHMVRHEPGCGNLLFQLLKDAHLRRSIEELPGA